MSAPVLCKHLRSKSMYIPALNPDGGAVRSREELARSHCWCNCTLTETGPDDHQVGAEVCDPARSCYEE